MPHLRRVSRGAGAGGGGDTSGAGCELVRRYAVVALSLLLECGLLSTLEQAASHADLGIAHRAAGLLAALQSLAPSSPMNARAAVNEVAVDGAAVGSGVVGGGVVGGGAARSLGALSPRAELHQHAALHTLATLTNRTIASRAHADVRGSSERATGVATAADGSVAAAADGSAAAAATAAAAAEAYALGEMFRTVGSSRRWHVGEGPSTLGLPARSPLSSLSSSAWASAGQASSMSGRASTLTPAVGESPRREWAPSGLLTALRQHGALPEDTLTMTARRRIETARLQEG